MTFSSRLTDSVRMGFIQAFASLAVPQYRLLWLGMLFSIGAMQIDLVARAWLAYDLSGSGLTLGLVTAARGLHKAPAHTPLEFARHVEEQWKECSPHIRRLTQLYCRVRFGQTAISREDLEAAEGCLNALKTASS